MVPGTQKEELEQFKALYDATFPVLMHTAKTLVKSGGSYPSDSGRAEELVQETFVLAWRLRDRLWASSNPRGWLNRALILKSKELLREDYKWCRRVTEMSRQSAAGGDFRLRLELSSIIPAEDFRLLKRLYVDKCTYAELCGELGVKKSTLAMRIKRIKERFVEEYEEK